MKINDVKPALGVDRVKGTDAPAADAASPKDRVTVQSTRDVQAAVASAKQAEGAGGSARASRMERLEAQVRSGSYKPDPSRMAEQILGDAEIDARLQALMKR